MPCVVPTINLFSIQEIGHPKWRVALGFRAGLFEGFFRTPCGHSAAAVRRHIQSLRPIRLIFTASIDFSARRCERIRTLKPPARGSPRRPCHCHRCQSVRRDRWSGVLRIIRGTAGELGSGVLNRGTAGALDRVAQIAERKHCRPQARPFRHRFRYCGGVPGPAWIRPAARQSFVGR